MVVRTNVIQITLGIVGIGTALYATRRIYKWWIRNHKWVKVGTVSQLMIHPIKSCRALTVNTGECTPLGLRNSNNTDRKLMLVSQKAKDKITAREEPSLVLLEPFIDESNQLTISGDRVETIKVDLNRVERDAINVSSTLWRSVVEGFDCGDEVSDWFSDYLGKDRGDLRLIYLSDSVSPRVVHCDPIFGAFFDRSDKSSYGDFTAYMLMTEQSLKELNNRYSNGQQFSMRRFRPNIIVDTTVENAFDEDNWSFVRFSSDKSEKTVHFACVSPGVRCMLTTVDPENGTKDKKAEPLRTLRKFRLCKPEDKPLYSFSPLLGINLGFDKGGPISVGDDVYVCYRD